MKIGIALPSHYAINGFGVGISAQAIHQADALEALGHEVSRLSSWGAEDMPSFDAVQIFCGGYFFGPFWSFAGQTGKLLAWSPIIDTNTSNRMYRLAARVGRLHPKIRTNPAVLQENAETSELILVRSKHERDRVVHGLGADPVKVEIVLNGTRPPVETDGEVARKAFDLPETFALHVSRYTSARKNVERLIEAVGPTGIPLVVAGHGTEGPAMERLRALAERFPGVRLLGFLDHAMLDSLYAACKVFCLPSVHEGTGLVALEAASHGAAIVITRNGGPPDYFLDHAHYVDPASTEQIRDAVVAAWESPRPTALAEHVRTNLTWERSAESLAAAYRKHIERLGR